MDDKRDDIAKSRVDLATRYLVQDCIENGEDDETSHILENVTAKGEDKGSWEVLVRRID